MNQELQDQVIGMPEACRRLGLRGGDSARRALLAAKVPLQRINGCALAVRAADLEAFVAQRSNYTGRGRPRKEVAISFPESAALDK